MKFLNRYQFKYSHLEGWFWIVAIALLALTNPMDHSHFSLCLFKNLGWGFCPGCGLGHAIAFVFRGELKQSFQTHPLAIPAIIILLHRSYTILVKPYIINQTKKDYEQNFSSPPRTGA